MGEGIVKYPLIGTIYTVPNMAYGYVNPFTQYIILSSCFIQHNNNIYIIQHIM